MHLQQNGQQDACIPNKTRIWYTDITLHVVLCNVIAQNEISHVNRSKTIATIYNGIYVYICI